MAHIDDIPRWKAAYKAAQKADDKYQAALVKEYGRRAGDMRYRPDQQPAHVRKLGTAYRKKSIALSKLNEYYRTHTQNPKRKRTTRPNSSPLLPAKVRINPRTGKVQVFVSPKVAAQVKTVKSNPKSSKYYWSKEGGMWVMRQKRYKAQRKTRGGQGHPHDIMAYAGTPQQARDMEKLITGSK